MFEVIGVEIIDYKSAKTGNQVKGKKIHYIGDGIKNGEGRKVDNDYISDNINIDVHVGDIIEIQYNKYGSIIGVTLC